MVVSPGASAAHTIARLVMLLEPGSLTDASGGVSVASESGCWVFGLSVDVFECVDCGGLYRLTGRTRRGRGRFTAGSGDGGLGLVRISVQ